MAKIAVIYWSGTGHTEAMATAVAEGINAAGGEAEVFSVSDISAADAAKYDKLALGCPAMGDEQLEESEFQPFFDELSPSLSGKKVVLFGSYEWAEGQWMQTWAETAKGLGAVFAADPVIAYDAPDDEAVAKCKALGEALAKA